ncbi:hypothetical protein [Burkholderia pseudomallei]|uniref:hypothetical protein n=1 Tax=Burkholderia pseudomallei TaxID=28450 RepID=UPI0009B1F8B6|nr:hypothetical protein [Burkholderia pseudomallei]
MSRIRAAHASPAPVCAMRAACLRPASLIDGTVTPGARRAMRVIETSGARKASGRRRHAG